MATTLCAWTAAGVGTIDPDRGLAAQRAYLRAFFDVWLRNRETQLLEEASAEYPEVVFMGF